MSILVKAAALAIMLVCLIAYPGTRAFSGTRYGTGPTARSTATCYGQVATAGNGHDNTMMGTAAADSINGLGGDDKIVGNGGDDALCGASGNDKLLGGDGVDVLIGGKGKDTLSGGPGDDYCVQGERLKSCEHTKLPNGDADAKMLLQKAYEDGLTYFVAHGQTYSGLTTVEAAAIDPSIEWLAGIAPDRGQVSISSLTGGTDSMYATRSASGTYFCIWDDHSEYGLGEMYGSGPTYPDVNSLVGCSNTSW